VIAITTGAPGNGKSLLVQTETAEELAAGYRDVVTSTPVRVEPWVTADGRGMVGLRHVMQSLFRTELDHGAMVRPGVLSFGRLLVVEDEAELSELFLWRRDQCTGEWFKCRWDAEQEKFHADDLKRMGPIYCVTDEAWKCYSSRRWKDTAKVTEFYGRQHRKFGDDWTIVSHSHKDLDVQINRMAQSWRICTNYGLRRLALFRQPAYFEVKTFYESPTGPSARCMHTKIVKLNPLLCQTYDTSAGVAVGGGRAADVNRRRKGLHPAWMLVGVLVIALCLFGFPHFFSKSLFGVMGKAASAGKRLAPAVTSKPPEEPKSVAALGVIPDHAREAFTNRVFMTGFESHRLFLGDEPSKSSRVTVYLSDGSQWETGDGHLQFLTQRFCVVDGVTNWYRPLVVSKLEKGADRSAGGENAPQGVGEVMPVESEAGSSVTEIGRGFSHMSHPAVRSAGGYFLQ